MDAAVLPDTAVLSQIAATVDKLRPRRHSKKIIKKHCMLDSRKFFSSQRGAEMWKSLPPEVVSSSSLNMFKGRLDSYMGSIDNVEWAQ